MSYLIASTYDQREIALIDQYPFGCGYQPKVEFSIWLQEGIGFHLEMTCFEKEPRAFFENHDEPVYKDSCMEFFVNFYPKDSNTGYLNFEMNAKGAMLLQYGLNKYERVSLTEKLEQKHGAKVNSDHWTVNLLIPLGFIEKVYGKSNFEVGQVIRANAYKCGDETAIKHYGSWNPVVSERPNFHKPECFGEMTIGGSYERYLL